MNNKGFGLIELMIVLVVLILLVLLAEPVIKEYLVNELLMMKGKL
jgi:Tfp pilus assembly protein PilE